MRELLKAIDVSTYGGAISADQWREVKADGYQLAVVGLWHGKSINPYANQQCLGALDAGLMIAGYVYLAPWTGRTGSQQVDVGMGTLSIAAVDNLRFMALDAECDGISEGMIARAIDWVIAYDLRPIIYTGRWWWVEHFGNPEMFKDLPLWTAQYPLVLPNQPNLLDIPLLYGGWRRERLVGWQWKGTTDLHGVNCDLNVFDAAFVRGEEEEMPRMGLYGRIGHEDVFMLFAGKSLVHVVDLEHFNHYGFQHEKVMWLPPDDDLWKLPTYYPDRPPAIA